MRYLDEPHTERSDPNEPSTLSQRAQTAPVPVGKQMWMNDANWGTSQEGDKFFRLPEVYVKGNNVRCQ